MKEHPYTILNHPVDVSRGFSNLESPMFMPTRLSDFDPKSASGQIVWRRYAYKVRMAFNQEGINFEPTTPWEFPAEYGKEEVELPFSVDFYGPRTLRFRFAARKLARASEKSLMLAGKPKSGKPWKTTAKGKDVTFKGPHGSVTVQADPWRIVLRDPRGRLLTQTQHLKDNKSLRNTDPLPFCFQRRSPEFSRQFAATFTLSPDEKIYGCGESFTRLNKRGQKVVLWAYDGHGVQHDGMYKPVPFFLSSRGYGMFLHTTAPATFDFGHAYDACTTLFTGDEVLDFFVFLGDPKEVVSAYTALTGRSPVPPAWSFGLWMSRCTYKSESETRAVAQKLREQKIPCDVVHLDTGWFEEDWRCDYRFSTSRFKNAGRMIRDLKKQGFRVSLWQLPYFSPKNRLFKEIVEMGLAVTDGKGNLPTEDATLDFSNPKTVSWYQKKLAGLLRMGVAAIKVDFGEAAPLHGLYASGKTGFQEHNLYPLRYNKAAAEITRRITGENIIWARSAWAGSQRYPLHWGGDAEDTFSAMAASLRGGLSFGLSGFSFWSHDIGGFVHPPAAELYRRWLPFGMLTSHSRCHGVPPREPWVYGKKFTDEFRKGVEMKYALMPYVLAQAAESSSKGHPMVRALFFEFPEDPTSWLIEDEYLFGGDLLVAPLFEESDRRNVYLPPGGWFDYQTGERFLGGRWHTLKAGPIPCVILVRDGAVLPHLRPAQSTAFLDWSELELRVFSSTGTAKGLLRLPQDGVLRTLRLKREGGAFRIPPKSLPPRVKARIL